MIDSQTVIAGAIGIILGIIIAAILGALAAWLFGPAKSVVPSEDTIEPSVEAMIADMMMPDDVIDYLSSIPTFDRLQVLREIQHRYCFRCGGDHVVKIGHCGCKGGSR